jgi:hypothetical protein
MGWKQDMKACFAQNKPLKCLSQVLPRGVGKPKSMILFIDFAPFLDSVWWKAIQNHQTKIMKQLFNWNLQHMSSLRTTNATNGNNTLAVAVDNGNPETIKFVFRFISDCVVQHQIVNLGLYVIQQHTGLLLCFFVL